MNFCHISVGSIAIVKSPADTSRQVRAGDMSIQDELHKLMMKVKLWNRNPVSQYTAVAVLI
jgi:hypothetical protein